MQVHVSMNGKLIIVVLLTVFVHSNALYNYQEKIDYYVQLVTNAFRNALTNVLPTDAYEYYSDEPRRSKFFYKLCCGDI